MELYFGDCPPPEVPSWYDEQDPEELNRADYYGGLDDDLDYLSEYPDYDDDSDIEDERYADDMDRAMDFARGDL